MNKTIGIFLHGQQGDIMSAMSVIKYRNELWGDSKIIWYAAKENFDLLKYQDNLEVREFPRGFGYPEMCIKENQKLIDAGKEPTWEDFQPLVDENNHMNLELKKNYPSLADIDYGYFPAPHQISVEKRHGLEYPNCSKRVFGIPDDWEWHPVLYFSHEEVLNVIDFIDKFPPYKIVCLETFAGSGQSKVTGIQIINAMDICRQVLGNCIFIFVSDKFINGDEKFPEGLINDIDVFSASLFTVRQCGLIVSDSDLLISVSSGISVAASAWGLHPTPIIQYCGSNICSTQALALGYFQLVTTDGKTPKQAWDDFEYRLHQFLK